MIQLFKIFSEIKKLGFRNSSQEKINNNIKLENGTVTLPKIGKVKVRQHRNIPADYILKSVTVSQTPSGKYYASILFEYENQVPQTKMQKFLGLDFSMHELYVDSNGNCPEFPRYYRLSEKKLQKEQRKLSNMVKDSKNSVSEFLNCMKRLPIKERIFCTSSQGR